MFLIVWAVECQTLSGVRRSRTARRTAFRVSGLFDFTVGKSSRCCIRSAWGKKRSRPAWGKKKSRPGWGKTTRRPPEPAGCHSRQLFTCGWRRLGKGAWKYLVSRRSLSGVRRNIFFVVLCFVLLRILIIICFSNRNAMFFFLTGAVLF